MHESLQVSVYLASNPGRSLYILFYFQSPKTHTHTTHIYTCTQQIYGPCSYTLIHAPFDRAQGMQYSTVPLTLKPAFAKPAWMGHLSRRPI